MVDIDRLMRKFLQPVELRQDIGEYVRRQAGHFRHRPDHVVDMARRNVIGFRFVNTAGWPSWKSYCEKRQTTAIG